MRSILVYADHGKAMRARLETALSLARMTDGQVSIMVDTAIACYAPVDPIGGSFIAADAIRETMARDDAHADEIEARLAGGDVACNVIRCEDEPVSALADAARLADVVVLSQDCDFAGSLALATRCPILLVPGGPDTLAGGGDGPGQDGLDRALGGTRMPIGRAAIAWDGGVEAAAALRASIPLLAGEVYLLTVGEQNGSFRSTDARRYLARHGIEAKIIEVERAGSTGQSLAAAASRLQIELLVMGAYGRSRMREYLFGGVTRHFLETEGGPALLLAH